MSIRQSDKRKTVFLCSRGREKIKELIEHKCVSLDMPNTACDAVTYYILNDRDMAIGIELKDIVWNHLATLLEVTLLIDKRNKRKNTATELQCNSFKIAMW